MKEFDFIRRYLNRQQSDNEVLLGIGDDAAIVHPQSGFDLCFSSDLLLSERHFFKDVAPADLAHKVLAVNISDMAAMGANPRWALLSVALPKLDPDWLSQFCDSLFSLANRFGVTLIGGDTTKGELIFNVTIVGELPRGQGLLRSSAKIGDDIWVSGNVGSAAAALAQLRGKITLPEQIQNQCMQALLKPEPRVTLGQALLSIAHAAQDISDGLAQDIGHILEASGVGAEIDVNCLPVLTELKRAMPDYLWQQWALAGGDDYELVFTAPRDRRDEILTAARIAQTPVSCIGSINNGNRLAIYSNGCELTLTSLGYDHFG